MNDTLVKKSRLIDQKKLAGIIGKKWDLEPEIIQILLDRIPIPNLDSFRLLIESLIRVGQTTWVTDAYQKGLWPSTAQLADMLRKVPDGGFTNYDPKTVGIKDRYSVYSALIDDRSRPPAWLESFRSLLVMLAWDWADQKASTKNIIGSAIRALYKEGLRNRKSTQELHRLANAKSVEDLANLAQKFDLTDRQTLGEAWERDVKPFFKNIKFDRASTKPDLRPAPSAGNGSRKSPEPDTEQERKPQIKTGIYRPRPISIDEQAEAPGDIGVPVEIFDVPAHSQATISQQKIELYRAKQAIWTRDNLLLLDAYESFSKIEATLFGKYLGESLEKANDEEARKLARMALLFITGRSTMLLSKGSVVQSQNSSPKAAWVLDANEGQIRHKAYRPEGAYEPNTAELELLEPVSEDLTLILPPTLAQFFKRVCSRNISLVSSQEEMEADINEACKLATSVLGFQVSPGRVRRAISRLLQNECRDIVSTMLICSDTFGLSDSHTYYTCPRISDLQQLYLQVTCEVFSDECWKLPISDERVGARLLVKTGIWRERSSSLADALVKTKTNQPGYRETHNALVDYLAGMIIDTAGHRPVDSLFRLTRGSFDLRGLGAVFQDKQSDAAHACRFVAIPEILASQVRAYLSHLSKLKMRLTRKSQGHIGSVLSGDAPLLFRLGLDDSIQDLSFYAFKEKLPQTWRDLPANVSRTYIATRGRDLDAHPESLAIQLGHLETAGFPFSGSSPTIPIAFAEDLSPILNQLAKDGGWKPQQGLDQEMSCDDAWESTGPIKNWNSVIAAHEQDQHKALRASRDSLRAQGRIARNLGHQLATEALAGVAPKLAEALATKAKPAVDGLELLSQNDVVELQKALLIRCGDNPIQSYASMHGLRTLLNRARRRFEWKGFIPFRWRVARRPQGTPFFPGMLTARDHIESLRDAFQKAPTKCPDGIDPVVWAFARTSLALLLFGFIDNPENLLGLLKNRRAIKRSSSLQDLLLVQWSDEPCRVTGLVGIAAIALAHLAWDYPDDEVPETLSIEKAIKLMLPEKSVKDAEGLIPALASLVSASNRIELSGAARTSVDPKKGSTCAEVSQQIAWIDGDKRAPTPSHPDTNKVRSQATKTNPVRAPSKTVRESIDFRPLAERQYNSLCALFPTTNRDSALTMTNEKISASNISRGKAKLIKELQSVSESPDTREVVAALAFWAIHMLENGTADTANPAFSTVEKYISTVGSDLVPLILERRITEMDEADLTATLVESVELKTSEKSKSLTARELRNFYKVVAPKLGFPDVELDELSLYLSNEPNGVDAELIFPSEVELAIAILNSESVVSSEESLATVRIHRQSSSAVSLLRATGTRSGELFGSKLRDLNFRENFSFFRVARNRNRRLKTPAANRRYLIEHRLSEATRIALSKWHDAERQRLTEPNRLNAYLFAAAESGKDFSTRQSIRDLAAQTLASVTGRLTERLHRLRHLVGTEALMWAAFSTEDRASVAHIQPLSAHAVNSDGVLFPRDFACHTLLLGHASPSTTISTYLHMPWVLFSRSNKWILGRLNRHTAAAAMGITPSGADRITQKRNSEPHRLAWLNHVIKFKAIVKPATVETSQAKSLSPSESIRQMTVFNLSQILDWTDHGATLAASAYAAGASQQLLDLIGTAAAEYKSQTGITFTNGDDIERQRSRTRRNSLTRHLNKLLDLLESTNADDMSKRRKLTSVANATFTRAKVTHRDMIYLPNLEARLLQELLKSVGHPIDLIELTNEKNGLLTSIRVKRKTDSKIYCGIELKRILGIVWVRQRVIDLAELQGP